jgi:Ser/Thr protein kinase RdoA (MazF antagonist)
MDVSEDFAANADNLKLMEEAAEGVEGKYEELAQAAAEDILIHADVSDLDMATDALDGLKEYLNGEEFANLNIGDAIDFDDTGLRQKINDLATATG